MSQYVTWIQIRTLTLNIRCNLCPRNAKGSLHTEMRRMNEHRDRIHHEPNLTQEELNSFESCWATKVGPKGSFTEVPPSTQVLQDFRSEGKFEQHVGLLRANIVLMNGEEKELNPATCIQYFHHGGINPFYNEVFDFFVIGAHMCRLANASVLRQHMLRDNEGNVSSKTFRNIQLKAMKTYAVAVSGLVYFATKCPWGPSSLDATNAITILQSLFFEKHAIIQQTFMTR